jgi:hypothetical protein
MMAEKKSPMTAACACGSVAFEARGAPIVSAVCYCNDCQAGARQIEALPNAQAVQDGGGGTAYIVFRKDRVTCTKGASLLKDYKIKEKSPTKRVVASCCNSAMFLGFDDAKHWLSMYRARFAGDVPPLQVRIQTKCKPGSAALPRDVPSYPGYPFIFMAKLLGARLAMLFG